MTDARRRLVLVAREFAPVTAGGIGALTRSIAERLDRDRFEPIVLLDLPLAQVRRAREELGAGHEPAGVDAPRVFGVDELTRDTLPLHAFRSEAYWRSFRIWCALRELCAQLQPDAIEFPDYEGLGYVSLKARRLGLAGGGRGLPPIGVRLHGTAQSAAEADRSSRAAPALLQTYLMEAYCLEHADFVVSPSPGVSEWYEERYELASPVHHGAPPHERVGPGDEHILPKDDGPLRLLFLGKLQPLKGVEELVRAAVACLDARGDGCLEVDLVGPDAPGGVGRDSFRRDLEGLIPARYAACLRFRDRLGHPEVRRIAAECHAAVFPSRTETFCLAAHELNWLGIPLVLSDIPAFRDHFVSGRDALFFDGSTAGLTRILADILDDREGLAKLSWNASRLDGDPSSLYAAVCDGLPTEARAVLAQREDDDTANSTSSEPRVSVVIPYFEMQDYADDAIASVEASVGVSWEIVLVDDGSTDPRARTHLDRLGRERAGDAGWQILRQPHGGLGRARNAGIAAARGEFILPLDADDQIHPHYLANAVRALDRRPDLSFVGCIAAIFRDGRAPESAREWIIPYDPDAALLLYENGAGTAACVFRRGVFEEHQYDPTLPAYEDWDLQLALARAGVKGESMPEVLFYYRARRGSLVRTRAHSEHDLLVASLFDKHFPELDDTVRRAFKAYIQVSSEMRGLGGGSVRIQPEGLRARLVEALRDVYHRWLKAIVVRRLPERQQRQLVTLVKRGLGASSDPPR